MVVVASQNKFSHVCSCIVVVRDAYASFQLVVSSLLSQMLPRVLCLPAEDLVQTPPVDH